MAGQLWQNGSDAIRACVQDRLLPKAMAREVPSTINLFDEFRAMLLADGAPATVAEERAEKWLRNLIDRAEDELADWEKQGVPRPFQWLDQRKICVTWNHPKYAILTGLAPLPETFVEIY